MDLINDPVATYEFLARFIPPMIDRLLPHQNKAAQPSGKNEHASDTRHADGLIDALDLSYRLGRARVPVRLFRSSVRLALGETGLSKKLSLDPLNLLVIETDGYLEQVDSLKAAFAGAPKTGFHIARDDLDEMAEHAGIVARQIGASGLSQTTQDCRTRSTRGRNIHAAIQAGLGFVNPSMYCSDFMKFTDHTSVRARSGLARIRED